MTTDKRKETMNTDIADKFDIFMINHRIASNKNKPSNALITHTELNTMKGSYSILDDDYDEFVKLYKDFISAGWEVGLVERHNGKSVGPVICDFDFKSRTPKRSYTINHITKIISIFHEIMIDVFKIDEDSLQAFVYEKDIPSAEKKQNETLYKDGFHIFWPYIPLLVEYRYLLYEIVLDRLKKEKTIEDIPSIEPLHEVFDYRVIYNNGIMMYGSTKPGRTPYKLTKVYTSDIEEMDLDDFDYDTIIQTSLMRSYDDDASLQIKNKKLINKAIEICKKRNYQTNLKRYLGEEESSESENENDNDSDNNSNNTNNDSDNDNSDNEEDNKKSKKKNENKYDNVFKEQVDGIKCACCNKFIGNPPHDITYIRDLITCLKRKRSDNYDDWIRVGWCLHRIWHGLLPEYINFSKKSKKYEPGCCERIWKGSNDSSYNLPSLILWAKQDDPERFMEIFKGRMEELFAKAMSSTHDDIANVLKEMYGNIYICANIKDNVWFEFVNHRWIKIDEAYSLNDRISTEVCAELFNTITLLRPGNNIDHRENDDQSRVYSKFMDVYKKLKDFNFKTTIIKACKSKFYDPQFEQKINKNTKLICFENGVFDLNTMQFREGNPEDFITFSTGYNFKEFSKSDTKIKEIEDYFSKVQTDPEVRQYLLRLIASYIDGSTKNQNFIFWPGSGGNGKSTTIDLIKYSFGDYSEPMPVKVLTGPTPDATVATPALQTKPGKRFAPVAEPDTGASLNIATMKLFTGNDEIPSRGLYQGMIYFKPQFKMVLATNKLPKIKDLDQGCWRRIIVLPFESRFVENPRANKPNEFKIDTELIDNKLESWKDAFMWYILRVIYPDYQAAEKKEKNSGLRIPKLVAEKTKQYRIDSDKYFKFLNEQTVKASEDDKEDINTLYPFFKEWYKEAYGEKPPNKQDFIEYFVKADYKIINDRFLFGYKLKDIDADM